MTLYPLAVSIECKREEMVKIRILLLLIGLATLVSCVMLPEPTEEENAFIVGRLVLSYPDGFVGSPPKDIVNGLRITIRDVDAERDYLVSTSRGFYSLTVPGGNYALVSYRYEESDANTRRWLGPVPVDLSFRVEEGTVVFLGDVTHTSRSPDVASRAERGSRTSRTFDYEENVQVVTDKGVVRGWIREQNPESAWLGYPVVVPKGVMNASW